MTEFRIEKDSLGEVRVPKGSYWGAQTQRSIENFPFESSAHIPFPQEFIRALGIVKRACAEVNKDLGLITSEIAQSIIKAAQEVIDGNFSDQFPLMIFQTGSGTQTNMNINEVIANRANEIMGGVVGSNRPVHPNDHVNRSQSSNDVIPTAMHISAVNLILFSLIPSLKMLKDALKRKQEEFRDIVKTGRTHLQDATPITFGQVFSGYVTQIEKGIKRVENALPHLYELALGGTAVGTGLNTHPEFAKRVASEIAKFTEIHFITGDNKFEGLAAHDAIVETSGLLRVVAVSLMKIANDIRWLGSGPMNGLGELILPINEPGSSIMPGKVNPTQSESVTQVVAQVIGNDVAIGFAGSQGNFELNVFKPIMIYNLLQSIQLLSNVSRNFAKNCISGLAVNETRIKEDLEQNLMLITGLTPLIGYEKAAAVAHEAYNTNKTLKEVLLARKVLSEEEIDAALDPSQMISPRK
ncbi:fumarate hydratase, class II [Candidatus Heimdallarchaeota archaeon B3_Heim]|nr:MAG: fumarate hydratase, class II [Candidatus Heimdallarchaeota archaeon B3_Heim]